MALATASHELRLARGKNGASIRDAHAGSRFIPTVLPAREKEGPRFSGDIIFKLIGPHSDQAPTKLYSIFDWCRAIRLWLKLTQDWSGGPLYRHV